ncbi:hypothetical protein P3X46_018442 [Hevea brasiliensis]|uniref:CCHC-type domain-containing protein n=1 Tax=Hevea brasiliensis TaxID=3981 RepID=A0ABQ9LQR0_HEVBR|nr:hypothetical protein P3X46_018442 [Hevea brasiliensis]
MPEFLLRVNQKIGKTVRVDETTMNATRGKFELVCVEVDLKKPLLAKFRLRRRVRRIKYEGIHLICFTCGCYGHQSEQCSASRGSAVGQDGVCKDVNIQQHKGVNGVVRNAVGDPVGIAVDGGWNKNQLSTVFPSEIMDRYGHWMLAKKSGRKVGNPGISNGNNLNARAGDKGKGKAIAVLGDKGQSSRARDQSSRSHFSVLYDRVIEEVMADEDFGEEEIERDTNACISHAEDACP